MFKLEIGLIPLAAVVLGGLGYVVWKDHAAAAAATTPAPGGTPAPTPPPGGPVAGLPTGVTTSTAVDATIARRDWDRGVLDGAGYSYNATVRGTPFDGNPTLTPAPGVANFHAYAAGHACGRAQGVLQAQRTIALFGAAAAAGLSFDPAPTAGGGVVTAACSPGFPVWLLTQGGSVAVSGRPAAAGAGPTLFGRTLWGGAPAVRRLVPTAG
jgi:hypothetical protein